MKKEPVSIKIDNSQGVHITYYGGIFMTLLSILILCGSVYVSPLHLTPANFSIADPISHEQADEIKKLVKLVADKEDKHPNKIHNELKKKLNYTSYRNISRDTYEKIKLILKIRLK